MVTDVRAPGAPVVANLTCQNANTMFLKWLRPKLFHRTVDVYHVMYRREGEDKWEKQVVETVNNTVNHMVSQRARIIMDSFAFTRPQSTCHLFIDCFRLIIYPSRLDMIVIWGFGGTRNANGFLPQSAKCR